MKKKTRKQLNKMMQRGIEPVGFLAGAATALAVVAALRSRPMLSLEHTIGEKLGDAWPKISSGFSEMTHAAGGLLSKLHLGPQNGKGDHNIAKGGMEKSEESESFSMPSHRATRPGRSSKRGSKE